MTRLYNDPSHFADEAIDGFVAANREWVERVAGHYPAFAGLVGPGMAAGAALGNVFASASTNQIVSVARRRSVVGSALYLRELRRRRVELLFCSGPAA
jgi:dihydroxyacetone kinase